MGVGRRLRQAREARGLSMAEVAERTKIPLRQLAAIEGEEYHRVPGGIFVRGHIRATARVVGLDPADLTEHFEEETRPPSTVAVPADHVDDHGPRLRMAPDPRESRPNGQLIAALLILLSIALAIAWFGRERDPPPASRNSAASGSGVATLAVAQSEPAVHGEPNAVGTVGTLGRARADGVPVSLRAQRVCWLALTVDGQRVAYRMLQQGETVTAEMHQRATVRTGDAGALLLSIGGQPEKPLGAAGAVRNIEFTRDEVPVEGRRSP